MAGRELVEVAPGVLVTTAATYTTTSTVVVAPDGTCLVVDPAITADDVAALAAELDRRGLVVLGGFTTHPHWDHLLWSPALGDAPRWGAPAAVEAALEHEAELRRQAADAAGEATAALLAAGEPVQPVADGAALPWAGPTAVVVAHDGHAPGHAALHLPDLGVLIAGDMLSDVEIPLLDREAAAPLEDYRAGLRRLAAVAADCDVVVPGHGSVAQGAEIDARVAADLAYLEALAAGREPDDPRLATPWLRTEHEAQRPLAPPPPP